MTSVLLGAIASLSWGLHDLLIRYISRSLGSLQSVFIVFISGAAVLLAAMWLRGEQVHFDGDHFWLIAAAGMAYAFAFVTLFKAFEIGPVSLVSPIVSAYPVLAIAWAVWNGRHPSTLEWCAVAGIIAGVILVARCAAEAQDVPGLKPAGTRAMAIIFSLVTCSVFAFSLTAGQIIAQAGSELNVTFVQRLWGIATLAPFSLSNRGSFAGARRLLPVLVVMGALDVMSITLVISAGKFDGAEYATVVASSYGAVTVALAVIFLKERLNLPQVLGMAMILMGIFTLSGRV